MEAYDLERQVSDLEVEAYDLERQVSDLEVQHQSRENHPQQENRLQIELVKYVFLTIFF